MALAMNPLAKTRGAQPKPLEVGTLRTVSGAALQHGPKMRALPNDRWRLFVERYVVRGKRKPMAAVVEAGFGCRTPQGLKQKSSILLRDPRVQEAIVEISRAYMASLTPDAVEQTHTVLIGEKTTNRDRLKAAEMVFDRAGMHALVEHKTTVEYIGDDPERIRRIAGLAEALGLSLGALLGGRIKVPEATGPVIDVQAETIEEGE